MTDLAFRLLRHAAAWRGVLTNRRDDDDIKVKARALRQTAALIDEAVEALTRYMPAHGADWCSEHHAARHEDSEGCDLADGMSACVLHQLFYVNEVDE